MPLLSLLVVIPIAGLALVAMVAREREALIHRLGLAVSLVVFALTLYLLPPRTA